MRDLDEITNVFGDASISIPYPLPLLQDVTTTPVIELSRQFWQVEEMVRSDERETLEKALKMVEPMFGRYRDMGRDRALAAAKILKAQALLGLGRPEEGRALLEEALPVLNVKLDHDMITRARGLLARAVASKEEAT